MRLISVANLNKEAYTPREQRYCADSSLIQLLQYSPELGIFELSESIISHVIEYAFSKPYPKPHTLLLR